MNGRSLLLGLFLAAVLAVIFFTWGSIGSAALTLGLLLAGIFAVMKKTMDRDNDYEWEE